MDFGKKIILGSASPRRRRLLEGMCIDFTVDTGNTFTETVEEGIPYREVPVRMSEGKSQTAPAVEAAPEAAPADTAE